jgi:hypothetical protein
MLFTLGYGCAVREEVIVYYVAGGRDGREYHIPLLDTRQMVPSVWLFTEETFYHLSAGPSPSGHHRDSHRQLRR